VSNPVVKLKVFVAGSFQGYADIDKQQYPQHSDEIITKTGNKYVIDMILGEDCDGTIVVGAHAVKPDIQASKYF
jgi:hypothetical protein